MASIYESFSIQNVSTKGPLTLSNLNLNSELHLLQISPLKTEVYLLIDNCIYMSVHTKNLTILYISYNNYLMRCTSNKQLTYTIQCIFQVNDNKQTIATKEVVISF